MTVSTSAIGNFVEGIAGKIRTPTALAGRLPEEAVDLGLASGLSAGAILAHVADSLHNQSLKVSRRQYKTIFPSELPPVPSEIAEERADVSLVLKDLCYVAAVALDQAESIKFAAYADKTFRVSAKGTLYAVKPHVQA